MLRSAVLASALSLALLPATAVAQSVCHAPVDLVFILDESGSVGTSSACAPSSRVCASSAPPAPQSLRSRCAARGPSGAPRCACLPSAAHALFTPPPPRAGFPLFSLSSRISPRADYYKSIDFIKEMVTRFQVGTGATDAQVALVKFASVVDVSFHLNTHTSNDDVIKAMAATTFNSGGTCTGWAMKTTSEDVLCPTCPGRAPRDAPSIAIFLTDGTPRWISTCNNANGATVDRIAEIKRLKGIVNRVIPVGIGNNIAGAYLQSLAKDMPLINGNNYISADYSNLGAILDDLATVACPTLPPSKAPTSIPTAEPSGAPTAQPSKAPTYDCSACNDQQKGACDMGVGRPGTCSFTSDVCDTIQCGCAMGTACSDTSCATCTSAPTMAPTSFPTMAPTVPPTFTPTAAPSPPTGAPTYWDLFASGEDNEADAAAKTAVGVASAGLGAVAIIAIILGVIAAIVLLAMIVAGVGIFAARKKLFATELTVDGKDIERTKAIGVGHQVRSIHVVARAPWREGGPGRANARASPWRRGAG